MRGVAGSFGLKFLPRYADRYLNGESATAWDGSEAASDVRSSWCFPFCSSHGSIRREALRPPSF